MGKGGEEKGRKGEGEEKDGITIQKNLKIS